MTADNVSDELVEIAVACFTKTEISNIHTGFASCMRAAINAIAPLLKAEGMREAAAITSDHIEKAMKDGVDAFVAVLLRNAILARADTLDPPPQKEQKPVERPSWPHQCE